MFQYSKYVLLSIILLFITQNASAQGCFEDGITFASQSQINNFPQDYPDCSVIKGDVFITGSASLDSLYVIKEIQGDLDITITPFIDCLEGFIGLEKIGGDLYIHNVSIDPELNSLRGFDNLVEIGGSLRIQAVKNIVDLDGFDKLTTVGGSFSLITNDDMLSLEGLNSLTTVGDILVIKQQNEILNISNLSTLDSVGGSLRIRNNAKLTSVSGLNNIEYVGGDIHFRENHDLLSLNACNHLDTLYGGYFLFLNTNLTQLNSLNNTKHIKGDLLISNGDIVSINSFQNIEHIEGYCEIRYQYELNSLTGLNNLHTIGGYLELDALYALNSFSALQNLTSINGELIVQSCENLTSLSGLQNIDYNTISHLRLFSNEELSFCSLPNICIYLELGGSSTLFGNAEGCVSTSDLNNSCSDVIVDADNDGFNIITDCNDEDPNINPDAIEIPNNNIDEDCDGLAFMIDEDGDGFNSDEDCDDDNSTVYPNAEEVPNNGIDEDCNGSDLVLDVEGTLWCGQDYADDNNSLSCIGALFTSDNILFVANTFKGITKYNFQNDYIGGWDIDDPCIALTADMEENIYVGVSGGDYLVAKYDQDGNLLQTFGTQGEANDIYVDDNLNVYVANQTLGQVFVYSGDGTQINSWNYPFDNGPTLITSDQSGNIYVGSETNIRKYTSSGTTIFSWSQEHPANLPPFGTQYGLEYNPIDESIYVIHSVDFNDRIYVYNTNGDFQKEIDVSLAWGSSISFSQDNMMVCSEWVGDKVSVYGERDFFIDYNVVNVNCGDDNNGAFQFDLYGVCGGVDFQITPSLPSYALTVGDYEVVLTFANNHSAIINFTVGEYAPISISAQISNEVDGLDNGSIELDITGGSGDFEYLWSNGSSTPTINELPAGTYAVTVIDINGCEEMASFFVQNMPSPVDADNDGYFSDEDCDDTNPEINPGAVEIPNNNIDEDCDGSDLVGTKETSWDDTQIYPNPTNGHLNITSESLLISKIELSTMDGRIVLISTSKEQINMGLLPNGLYLISIETDKGILRKRVVKI